MEGHYSPEMLQQGQMMFQGMPGMSGPGQMPQMPYGNMEQLQNQVAQVPMQNQAQGHPHPTYAMQGHMGMQGMAQGMPQQMQGMAQGMGQMQGMPQGMPQGMSPGMSADGSMVPFQMGGDQQAAQAAQHGAQMMPHGAAGGCGCQGNPCGACATAGAQGACGGNCGGYVFQPMQNMMMPQNMMAGQMAGVGGQASGQQQQQQAQQQQAQQQQQQFHPNMQVFMVPGGGQMQPGMAGMQMQGQMAMHGMQGQMPHMPGHMPDGHGNQPGAVPPGDQGHGHGGEGPGDGDAKGGPGRMAAGRRNTQPKQGGASWGGASRSGRPDMRGPDSEVPAVPGEQGKGAGNQPASPPNPDGQKGMRKPKNPWADIQDSGGLDQEMAQMWAIGQMPAMDNQQKSGFKGKSGKKEGKNEGKTDGKTDDSGGKGDMKNVAQHKWVEKNNNNAGKGQKGMRQDQWQPTLGSKFRPCTNKHPKAAHRHLHGLVPFDPSDRKLEHKDGESFVCFCFSLSLSPSLRLYFFSRL